MVLIMPFTGVIPCTGPWGYHPGRGRGGNPSPSTKTILALPQGPRPGAGAFVVRARAGRGQEAGPYTALLSSPALVSSGSTDDITEKAGQGIQSSIIPSPSIILHPGHGGYTPVGCRVWRRRKGPDRDKYPPEMKPAEN